jgi:hypothetical protein
MIPGKFIGLDVQYLEYVVDGAAIIMAFAITIYDTQLVAGATFERGRKALLILALSMLSFTSTKASQKSLSYFLLSLSFRIVLRIIWVRVLFVWNTNAKQRSGHS